MPASVLVSSSSLEAARLLAAAEVYELSQSHLRLCGRGVAMGLFSALRAAIHLRGEPLHPNDAKANVVRLIFSRKAIVFSGEQVAVTVRGGTAKRREGNNEKKSFHSVKEKKKEIGNNFVRPVVW